MRACEHIDYDFYQMLELQQSELISSNGYPEKYYTLLGLKQLVDLYLYALSKKRVIESIDWVNAYSSFIKTVLNDRNISSKNYALNKVNDLIKIYELELFKKLDAQTNPYYILLCPIYSYKNLFPCNSFGWVKDPHSGVRDLSLIACENYFKYKIKSLI